MPYTTQRLRHDPKFRLLDVVETTRLTPGMMRIVLGGDALRGFTSLGFDDHIRLFFPAEGQPDPAQPVMGADGPSRPDPKPRTRDYTPRAFDPHALRLTIDFVLHPGGVAADWAAEAKIGHQLGIGGPKGSFVVDGTGWQILAGDATALPAIARRLEELPATTQDVTAVIEVASPSEILPLAAPDSARIHWLCRSRSESLLGWLHTLTLPKGDGFMFLGAEAGVVTRARDVASVVTPGTVLRLSNYWHAE